MKIGELLGSFFGALLRSVFISIVLFMFGWYLVTKEFPPKVASVKRSFDQLQQFSQLSFKILEEQKRLQEQKAAGEEIATKDVESLQELVRERAQLGLQLIQPSPRYGKGLSPEELALRIDRLENRLQALEGASRAGKTPDTSSGAAAH